MKKAKPFIVLLLIICTLSSCATLFGGHVNAYQRTRPTQGQPSRSLRPVAFIADLLLCPVTLIVDFATCAIYKPHNTDAPEQTTPTAPTQGTSK